MKIDQTTRGQHIMIDWENEEIKHQSLGVISDSDHISCVIYEKHKNVLHLD